DAQGAEHGGIRADAEVRLVDHGLDHRAVALAAREQAQRAFAAADRERAVDLHLGRRHGGRHGARPEIDCGMPARVEHVLCNGRLDLAAIPLGQGAQVVLAAGACADDAERGRVEPGVNALVIDGDLESLDAELEIVGHAREEAGLVREEQALRRRRVERDRLHREKSFPTGVPEVKLPQSLDTTSTRSQRWPRSRWNRSSSQARRRASSRRRVAIPPETRSPPSTNTCTGSWSRRQSAPRRTAARPYAATTS